MLPNGSLQLLDGVPKTPFVAGGSGRTYYSITDAIFGEQQTLFADTTQAGTTDGVVFGSAALPATDDALNGFIVLLTDLTPGNGIAATWARVVDYVGATRKMFLDTPVNFGVGELFQVFSPIRISVDGPLTENVQFSGPNIILNLGGNVLTGQIDIVQGNWAAIMNGTITKGIVDSRSTVSALRLDDLTLSPRDTNGYALQKTNATDIGSIEAYNCDFRGIVAGQQGICRWVIKDCVNIGFVDGVNVIPYRLVESLTGMNITFSNISVNIDSVFEGAIFAAFGTGTIATSGGTKFLDLEANIRTQTAPSAATGSGPRTQVFSVVLGQGASITSVNPTTGRVAIGYASPSFDIAGVGLRGFSLVRAKELTGSVAFTFNASLGIKLDFPDFITFASLVTVDGTGTTTGTVDLNGTSSILANMNGADLFMVHLFQSITGTAAVTIANHAITVNNAGSLSVVQSSSDQTAGTPTVTVSSALTAIACAFLNIFNTTGTTINVGTWAVSSAILGNGIARYQCALEAGVGGGTWTNSGNISLTLTGDGTNVLDICTHAGGGGTLAANGTFNAAGGIQSAFRHCRGALSGGSATRTGATYLTGIEFINAFTAVLSVAGATAVGSGEIHLRGCQFRQANAVDCTIVTAGGASTGPSFVAMDYCLFERGLITNDGAGALTWANAQWAMSHSSIFGLFTVVGDAFLAMTFWFDTFWGDTNDFSIAFSGARPTFYRFWKCNFGARNDGGLPEIIDDYAEVPNDANAKTRGELQVVNASGQAVDPAGSSSDAIEGVVLGDVAASAGDAVRLVRRGKVFVDVDNAVAAGDNLIEDTGTPTQAKQGNSVVGQRIGRALEAAGATNAGEAYSIVNLM